MAAAIALAFHFAFGVLFRASFALFPAKAGSAGARGGRPGYHSSVRSCSNLGGMPLSCRRYAGAAILFLSLVAALPLAAAPCTLEAGETHKVTDVIDGDTVLLDDGREVRLTGIQAPKLPLGRKGFEAWPLAGEAHDAMTALAVGQSVTLHYGGARIDRHRRVLAQLFAEGSGEPIWLQREMLRRGLARVYTFHDNRACADELLAAEREARTSRRGIWRHSFYAIRDASDVEGLERLAGRFELVEGTIVSAALVRDRLYLNFGDDYRTDFTVTAAGRAAKLFLETEPWLSLLNGSGEGGASPLAGRKLRVRGWIERHNGPEISVTHPEQIELLNGPD